MENLIDPKSLIRVSKFAKQCNKSAAWVHKLAEDKEVDMIVIDEYHFIRVNEKSRKFVE